MPRDLKTLLPPLVDSRCTECGALVPSHFGSCDELFMSLLTPLGMQRIDLSNQAAHTAAAQHTRW